MGAYQLGFHQRPCPVTTCAAATHRPSLTEAWLTATVRRTQTVPDNAVTPGANKPNILHVAQGFVPYHFPIAIHLSESLGDSELIVNVCRGIPEGTEVRRLWLGGIYVHCRRSNDCRAVINRVES